jgi:hypothetical protein
VAPNWKGGLSQISLMIKGIEVERFGRDRMWITIYPGAQIRHDVTDVSQALKELGTTDLYLSEDSVDDISALSDVGSLKRLGCHPANCLLFHL